jgi:hypothetical protein
MSLTAYRVHLIRTSGKPDTHWARIWRLHVQTIRAARRGESWSHVQTPPDIKPRSNQGNWGEL